MVELNVININDMCLWWKCEHMLYLNKFITLLCESIKIRIIIKEDITLISRYIAKRDEISKCQILLKN